MTAASANICNSTLPVRTQCLCLRPVQLAEIDRLNQEKDVTQVCPFYLDLLSEAARLQVMSLLLVHGVHSRFIPQQDSTAHYASVTQPHCH